MGLETISKMTVLSALCIITSEVMFTAEAMGIVAGWFTESDSSTRGLAIWYIGWDVDMVINALSLFLSFDFNDGRYKRCCCGLHRSCMFVCDKCSRRQQVANTNDLEIGLLSL